MSSAANYGNTLNKQLQIEDVVTTCKNRNMSKYSDFRSKDNN